MARELREAEADLAEAEEGLALTKTAVSSPTGLCRVAVLASKDASRTLGL